MKETEGDRRSHRIHSVNAIKQERDTCLARLTWNEILSELGPEPLITVDRWDQTVEIMPNGDTHEVQVLDAVAVRDVVLFVRLTARSRWHQHDETSAASR